ncbi:LytR/AlgR family response regulator transcription factor [Anaerosporobacter sp.]|uniref:LytR/AlgR family response regulator transcription factor n=1 Tax=Anaerosporobacter sp. TaxID=1872529 RepID=UPI00286ECDBB|nr:response regulator transcription factor [Anaerosporobacter sp.]
MNFRIAICDDSKADTDYISTMVSNWAELSHNKVNIKTFTSAEEFLFHYADNTDYDILLLDIEMGKMDGIELAKKIRDENNSIQIVFITGFPDFIAEGYEVSALHYLIKPVPADKLWRVLDKAAQNLQKFAKHVIFNLGGKTIRVEVCNIVLIEAFAHSCTVTTTSDEFQIRTSISDIEKMFGDEFIRCHRSYIVGIRYIKSISKTEIILDNGITVPLSRNNYNMVNQAFIRYFREII